MATDKLAAVYTGTPPDVCVCDQALRIMPNGDWVIIFMTGGDTEPRKENYIALCRSTDKGQSWGDKETVLKFDDKACTLSEVYAHEDQVRVHVTVHDGNFGHWENFTITSKDSGKTWEDPVPFEPMPKRAFIRNLYASTWGTWYLPFHSYVPVPDEPDEETETDAATEGEAEAEGEAKAESDADVESAPEPEVDLDVSPLEDGSHQRAHVGVLMSDDQGETWTASEVTGPIAGWAENNVVELSDETLVMLIRADGTGNLQRSTSSDKGNTWSEPEGLEIPNPSSKFRMHRLSDGRIVLVHNPNVLHGVRNPLAVWMTDDDMRQWRFKKVICDMEGQLQYPDGFVDEEAGRVHIAFDHNRNTLMYLATNLPDVMGFKLK
ncbi:MAG: exo-alpha-sialidase [Planctomycetes bacterium]|nr:exo-alpha-sialidase [Planctomycetota bacterium]